MRLHELVRCLDTLLDHAAVTDYPNAVNGLQVENSGEVRSVAVALDSHLGTLQAAVAAKVDLLLIHHGLFWNPMIPVTGVAYRKIKLCMDNDLAVYASHLPLKVHPELGTSMGLARALSLEGGEPWFQASGHLLGRRYHVDLERAALVERLRRATGQVKVLPWGPERVRELGILTGGGGVNLYAVKAQGVDTFLTGEGGHCADGMARDLALNVLYGGHYATEAYGVQALGSFIERQYGLPAIYLEAPSGL